MSWCEVVFEAPRDAVEAWSDALLQAGALAVNAEDADADSADEQALYGEPGTPAPQPAWRTTRLSALLAEDLEPEPMLAAASRAIGRPAPPFTMRRFDDRDWVLATQSQFQPIEIGDRLLVAPSWDASVHPGRVRIVLDPGLAFGTGTHPTTRLCLEWLDRNVRGGEKVIDYGCGSGILAIAAARLGAAQVTAIDIDPQAVDATRRNAQRNGVRITATLASGPPPVAADMVLANILSNPLKLMAPLLVRLVAPGGTLLLSGVLERQCDEVCAAYRPLLELRSVAALDGWTCLAGRLNR